MPRTGTGTGTEDGDGGPPGLTFAQAGVAPAYGTAEPAFDLRLTVEQTGAGAVQSLLLTAAVSIAPARRGYDARTRARLGGVFGRPEQWDSSLRNLQWVRATVVVPAFRDATTVTVQLPCSYDFRLATATYLDAVRDGDVTLETQLSGTVFYRPPGGGQLLTAQLPWENGVTGKLPATAWHELMGRYHGDERWISLSQESVDRLAAYRTRQAATSWDEAVNGLLDHAYEGEAATWT